MYEYKFRIIHSLNMCYLLKQVCTVLSKSLHEALSGLSWQQPSGASNHSVQQAQPSTAASKILIRRPISTVWPAKTMLQQDYINTVTIKHRCEQETARNCVPDDNKQGPGPIADQ